MGSISSSCGELLKLQMLRPHPQRLIPWVWGRVKGEEPPSLTSCQLPVLCGWELEPQDWRGCLVRQCGGWGLE